MERYTQKNEIFACRGYKNKKISSSKLSQNISVFQASLMKTNIVCHGNKAIEINPVE